MSKHKTWKHRSAIVMMVGKRPIACFLNQKNAARIMESMKIYMPASQENYMPKLVKVPLQG